MPKRKRPEKRPVEMTSAELAKQVFGTELKEQLDQIAHEKDPKPAAENSSQE